MSVAVEIENSLNHFTDQMQTIQSMIDEVNKTLAELRIKQLRLSQGVEEMKRDMEDLKKLSHAHKWLR